MYNEIVNKRAKIAVIGLGYVGLPIALEFAKKTAVIGFDINKDRVIKMQNKVDPSGELDSAAFEGCDIVFTDSLDILREARFFIVAVPTPIDEHKLPDLKPGDEVEIVWNQHRYKYQVTKLEEGTQISDKEEMNLNRNLQVLLQNS